MYPSSGACVYSVELPHWSYCSWFDVCWSFGVVGLECYPCCRLKNNTTNVVIQQNSRKLLMVDILMSETCWAHKWNKITSDIKLVFCSSAIHYWINSSPVFNPKSHSFVVCRSFYTETFFMAPHPLLGQGLIVVASLSHSDTQHSVALHWTSDRHVAEICTWQHSALKKERHPYLWRDSNPQSPQSSGRRPKP